MKEWSKEMLYRELKNPDEIKSLHDKIKESVYRQTYHIQPTTGLLNDPNGFIFHNGIWHLFYQWCPWGAVHGLKYWYHTTSTDLIHWKNEGLALKPDTLYDNRGVYSGTALLDGDKINLYYTGNHRAEDWTRTAYTCLATLNPDGTIIKKESPLFGPAKGFTEHQRDPKIIHNTDDNKYYIILGAQDENAKGCALLYSSDYPDRDFKFVNKILVPGFEEFGNMWECPSLEHIDGKDVLIFCPQNITLPKRSYAQHHNGYIIGSMDFEEAVFIPDSEFIELDSGFDHYAAQCAANTDRHVIIGWMGNADCTYPVTDEEDWAGCMTLPRELHIRNNKLIQCPVKEIESIRGEELPADTKELPLAAELLITSDGNDFYLSLFKNRHARGLMISYNSTTKKLGVDRSGLKNRINTNWGESRTKILDEPLTKLRIFIDHSSIEIFVNDGEAVFSGRIFLTEEEKQFVVSENATCRIFNINPSVTDDFII